MRKGIVLILIIVISLLVSGCWSRKELDELAIAMSLGIDKADDQYLVSVQLVNPSEVAVKAGGGGYQTPVTVFSTVSPTLLGAVRNITSIAPRKVYLAQLRTIVIGEDVAKDGIGPVLDYLARDREIREEDLFILIAKEGKAMDTLKVLTHLDKIPAMKMYGALQTLEKYWASIPVITLNEVAYALSDGKKYPVIPGVFIVGDVKEGNSSQNVQFVESPAFLQFGGTAAFYKDKLVGWLNETEGKGFNYISDRVHKTNGDMACPNDGIITMDVIRSKTRVKGKVKNGMPEMDVYIRLETNVADVQCDIDITDTKVIDELQKLGAERLEEVLRSSLDKVQHELKTDIFGFGEVIHRANPREWKKLEDDWIDIFPEVPVNIHIKYFIRNVGTQTNTFYKMKGEQ